MTPPGVVLQVLIALTAVILAGQLLARLFAYVGQPPVIGEVAAGILLGPSLLGPRISAWVLPPDAAPYLGVIAQLGVILYMFVVGLELDVEPIRHRLRAVAAISTTSILVPFALGLLLAMPLYPRLSTPDVPFLSFALFMGVALSITAFPVLARILGDRRMARTPLGVLALSSAAVNDVAAWCMLAVVLGIVRSEGRTGLAVVIGTAAYIALMFFVVRPLVRRLTPRSDAQDLSHGAVGLVFAGLLLSALATEAIGIHAIFGAFLLGAVIPHDGAVARVLTRQLEQVVPVLLLPAFFAFIGMRTRIDLLSGAGAWLICGLIVVVATVGKVGGTWVAAWASGLGSRQALTLGALMNTRGLMELIVLNIALDLGVISPTLFAMMVVMALVTTLATAPALRFLMQGTHGDSRLMGTGD